jgi:hypothetical protein
MATPGALNAFAATGENPINFIVRHMNLDTGSLGADDQLQNIRAVREGTRVLGLRIAGRHSHLDLHRSGSLRDHHPAARGVLARLQFDRRGSRLSGHHGFDVASAVAAVLGAVRGVDLIVDIGVGFVRRAAEDTPRTRRLRFAMLR